MPRKPQRKPKPSAVGVLRLEVQRRVVEPQLLQRLAEVREVVGVDREQAGEHARLHLLEARQAVLAGLRGSGQRVADRRAVDVLDAAHHEADFARSELVLDDCAWA